LVVVEGGAEVGGGEIGGGTGMEIDLLALTEMPDWEEVFGGAELLAELRQSAFPWRGSA
jgi:hypothetical protein